MDLSNFILVADLHLTNNPNDEYRWSIFKKLAEIAVEEEIESVILAGDIADFKDNHSADFVNRLTDAIKLLAETVDVHFLMGNHDAIKLEVPFFEFIKHIDCVYYHKTPVFVDKVALLPYTKGPEQKWSDLDFSGVDHIIMHQPCIGARSSDFYELESGMSPKYFSEKHNFEGSVWSGDIHLPQVVGDVEYVGAPYPVRAGDKIDGRCIVFYEEGDDWEIYDVELPNIKKWSISITHPDELIEYEDKVNQFRGGDDHMKIKVLFSFDAYKNWKEWKKVIKEFAENKLKVIVQGITLESKKSDGEKDEALKKVESFDTTNPNKVLSMFSKREKIDDDLIDYGKQFLKGTAHEAK